MEYRAGKNSAGNPILKESSPLSQSRTWSRRTLTVIGVTTKDKTKHKVQLNLNTEKRDSQGV